MLNLLKRIFTRGKYTPLQKVIVQNPDIINAGGGKKDSTSTANFFLCVAAAFVPAKPTAGKSYQDKFYNDKTIFEIVIFYVFNLQLALCSAGQSLKQVDELTEVSTLVIADLFGQVHPEYRVDFGHLIKERLNDYLHVHNEKKNIVEFLANSIITTQTFGFNIKKRFESMPISDDFIEDMQFKEHLARFLQEFSGKINQQLSKCVAYTIRQ
jgi:hypothetical protein